MLGLENRRRGFASNDLRGDERLLNLRSGITDTVYGLELCLSGVSGMRFGYSSGRACGGPRPKRRPELGPALAAMSCAPPSKAVS